MEEEERLGHCRLFRTTDVLEGIDQTILDVECNGTKGGLVYYWVGLFLPVCHRAFFLASSLLHFFGKAFSLLIVLLLALAKRLDEKDGTIPIDPFNVGIG